MRRMLLLVLCAFFAFQGTTIAQRKKDKNQEKKEEKLPLQAFKFRNIGPAFLSGRIADIAMHPEDENVWYAAVGSGGVWKTEDAGTTWENISDGYFGGSIGSIALQGEMLSRPAASPGIAAVTRVGGRTPGCIHEADLPLSGLVILLEQAYKGSFRRHPALHQRQSFRPEARVGERLCGHGSGAGLRPGYNRTHRGELGSHRNAPGLEVRVVGNQ